MTPLHNNLSKDGIVHIGVNVGSKQHGNDILMRNNTDGGYNDL